MAGQNHRIFWSVLAIAVMAAGRFLPATGQVSELGMEVCAILLGAIIAYCTVGMIWPSILALILLGLTDGGSVTTVFRDSFGNPIVLYLFFLLIFGTVIDESGLADYFARWLVTRKIARGRPWLLTAFILFAAYFTGLFIGMIPATVICWAIIYNICAQAGYGKGDPWPLLVLYGVLFLSTVSSGVMPFQMGVVTNYGILSEVSGGALTYEYLPYLLFAAVYSFTVFIAYIFCVKHVYQPDLSALRRINAAEGAGSMDKKQKTALALLLLFVFGLMLPSFLPPSSELKTILDNIGPAGWTALVLAVGMLLQVEGKALVDFPALAAKGLVWDVLLMMATIFTLSGSVVRPETGVPAFLTETLLPLLGGINPVVFTGLILCLITIAANLINNLVVLVVSIPLLYTLSAGMDVNVVAITGLLIFLGNACFLFPSSCPQASMIYQNLQWVEPAAVRRLAVLSLVILLAAGFMIGLPLSLILL
ncbi:MAG: hypothetical protein LBS10_07595 [Gracilibacteraceae bacterium]|jgi:sodium-dependent dicarboxylate transporter 2/3/5|nr:hypothetical protein [Gracilibacteraceae bacterium]